MYDEYPNDVCPICLDPIDYCQGHGAMILPEEISAVRKITYNVSEIIEEIKSVVIDPHFIPNIDYIINYIENWAVEDMSHPPSSSDIEWEIVDE